MSRDYYTNYPRTILWLVRGGTVTVGGAEETSQPAFSVDLEPFYISKSPITNQQYEAFDPKHNRAPSSPGDRDPVVNIGYDDAEAYTAWYADIARKPFRLPTEIEWEYACRAGSTGRVYFDEDRADEYMWHAGNSPGGRVGPIEEKKTNDWGLWGFLGGVWEWTASPYRPFPPDDEPARNEEPRVIRGGSFRLPASEISASLRAPADRKLSRDDLGFRIVRNFR